MGAKTPDVLAQSDDDGLKPRVATKAGDPSVDGQILPDEGVQISAPQAMSHRPEGAPEPRVLSGCHSPRRQHGGERLKLFPQLKDFAYIPLLKTEDPRATTGQGRNPPLGLKQFQRFADGDPTDTEDPLDLSLANDITWDQLPGENSLLESLMGTALEIRRARVPGGPPPTAQSFSDWRGGRSV